MKTSPLAFAAVFGTVAPGFVQAETSVDLDIWRVLSEIQIEEIVSETSYEVRKTFPEDMDVDLEGVEITGYAVAMLPGGEIRDLILTSDTGNCPLCGGFGHNATLQVTLDTPLMGFEDGARITVSGTLSRVEDSDTWQAAKLTGARIVKL
ncbi:hypothetical protein K3X41_08400 [Aliiroseovarius crassostreae]|uniref:hypothetical protein n=1 Tax=Aliiroseovarius crassostreae TaxID=154981 RepID=UPI0021FFCAD8|nr:hypothetical protein [Aliiroseovarius crassostreae]UWQ06866.1 hypothetical protein K3X25_08540 [Aliiroseovarius crassostreae]UWQ09969.1 hypothetical protein K3X41_08400 [Aliiroseovarius crassostreae]